MPEQAIHKELIPINQQGAVIPGPKSHEIPCGGLRDETLGQGPGRILTEGAAFGKGRLEKLDGFHQRGLCRGGRPRHMLEERAEMTLKLWGHALKMLPL